MAKGNFLLGTVSRKLGDMVFFRRAGQQIIRARVRTIRNPQTDAQAAQRSRFGALLPIFRLLNGALYGRLRIGWSQYNSFFSRNLRTPRPNNSGQLDFFFDIDYPFLTPPTPRLGLGAGLSVHSPFFVTQGTLSVPVWGAATSDTAPEEVFPGTNGLTSVWADGDFTINPAFYVRLNRPSAIVESLRRQGIEIAETGTVTKTNIDGVIGMRAIAEALTGNRHTHIGFLMLYSVETMSVIERAAYNEFGDITSGVFQFTVTQNNLTAFQATLPGLTNSVGERFMVKFFTDAVTEEMGNCLAFTLKSETANYNAPTACAVITSRRRKGRLLVSDTRVILDDDAGVAYQALFTDEMFAQAIRDYQRQEAVPDGLNLEIP